MKKVLSNHVGLPKLSKVGVLLKVHCDTNWYNPIVWNLITGAAIYLPVLLKGMQVMPLDFDGLEFGEKIAQLSIQAIGFEFGLVFLPPPLFI